MSFDGRPPTSRAAPVTENQLNAKTDASTTPTMLTAATVFLILTPPRRCSDVDDPHISCAGISTVVPLRIRRPSARRPAHCASIASTSDGLANPHDNQSCPCLASPIPNTVTAVPII